MAEATQSAATCSTALGSTTPTSAVTSSFRMPSLMSTMANGSTLIQTVDRALANAMSEEVARAAHSVPSAETGNGSAV